MSWTYARELPTIVQEEICKILDQDRAWEGLVKRLQDMKINIVSIEKLKQEKESSPPRKLLELLMYHNFKDGHLKISALYIIFGTLKLFKAMHILKQYVNADVIKKVEDAMKRPTSSVTSSLNDAQILYIHDLPEHVRSELCTVMDANGSWKVVMGRFEKAGFDYYKIELCQMDSPNSPTSELLKLLGDRNFKISLLYGALASLGLTQAMGLLQQYVSENMIDDSTMPDLHRDNISKETNLRSPPVAVCGRSPPINTPQDLKNDFVPEMDSSTSAPTFSREGYFEISYRELVEATNQWSIKNRLSSKSTGKFYHGVLNKTDKVAIKRLKLKDKDQTIRILIELRQLRSADHKNVLKMRWFTEGNGDYYGPCLIYSFLEYRSLYDYLDNKDKKPTFSSVKSKVQLSCWQDKQKIALGVAEALLHLHSCFKSTDNKSTNQSVVVKSSDILLTEKMDPLVVDVCPPCLVERDYSESVALYLPQQDPEAVCVESFCLGVILLELVMGEPAAKFTRHPEEFCDGKICMDNAVGLPLNLQIEWKALCVACIKGAEIPKIIEALKSDCLAEDSFPNKK